MLWDLKLVARIIMYGIADPRSYSLLRNGKDVNW